METRAYSEETIVKNPYLLRRKILKIIREDTAMVYQSGKVYQSSKRIIKPEEVTDRILSLLENHVITEPKKRPDLVFPEEYYKPPADKVEAMNNLLVEELINKGSTHENAPPGHDCIEECGISSQALIEASNPIISPMRSGGNKHKRCEDCWQEYVDWLTREILSLFPEYKPVELEALTDEEIKVLSWNRERNMEGYLDNCRRISQATVRKNQAKGQLYRVKEGEK